VESTGLLGTATCLLAAALWAVAVMMFRRPIARLGAPVVNLAKCLVATVLLAITALALGSWRVLIDAAPEHLGWLVLSGLVGMTFGDTALFAAVNRIGAHRSLLLLTLAPLFTAMLAAVLTGERLSPREIIGGLTILGGVILVVTERAERNGTAPVPRGVAVAGVLLGLLGALGQGSGVVFAKQGMSAIPVLPATLFRLAAATIGLIVVVRVMNGSSAVMAWTRERAAWREVVPATIVGTYLAMLLMMAGIAMAPASIAAVLVSTTPVFSLVLEAVDRRRWPSAIGVIGTLVAIGGVVVLSYSVS
jgi:drug/metabolite transporter (DMT)-like permease